MPDTLPLRSLTEMLRAAIDDLSTHGFNSRSQIETWLAALRTAAERDLGSEGQIDERTKASLDTIFRRLIDRGRIVEWVPEVGRYTIGMMQGQLRAELDRRILAAANLIKLNRREAIEVTLRRFSGWATSIPPGGEGVIDKREVRAHIVKDMRQLRYERRVVQIDQGHKLAANIADIVATGNGAIAAAWHHVREAGYDARPAHIARDGHILLIRDSWAHQAGLVKPGKAGYVDEVERPGYLIFCRCTYRYLLSPRRLPDSMLTRKGMEWIAAGGERSAA